MMGHRVITHVHESSELLSEVAVKRGTKRYRRDNDPAPIRLMPRDREAIAALAIHRFLTTEQLQRLVFRCSASRVRRRMRALYDNELVARVPLIAQPTAGIPPFVYTLARHGLAALDHLSLDEIEKRLKTSTPYVRHRLAVNDFFISLTEATRGTPYRIRRWWHEHQLRIPTNDGQGRAERFRHPSLSEEVTFLPDAAFELEVTPGRTFFYFLEIDRATHPQRIWWQRASLYTAYADARLGLFRRRFGRETFRLLTVTNDDFRQRSRGRNILNSIHGTVGPSELFLVTTFSRATADQILSPVWRQPGSDGQFSILGNAQQETVRRVASRPVVVRRSHS